jgi:hypothetical protein
MTPPWAGAAPNHGFFLAEGGEVVGAGLAFYSERNVDGRVERFCNLGAFCVEPNHRAQGLRLLRALLGQPGFHFTDLSPSGNVVALNERLGFKHLDTTTALIPNARVPAMGNRSRLVTSPSEIEGALSGSELRVYQDHRGACAVRHILILVGQEQCYVIARKDRRKGLPLFASILYASDPAVLSRSWGTLSRHLLVHFGAVATLAELRVVGSAPRFSVLLKSPRPKMFRSKTLGAESIDNLYSELTCVAW